MMKVHDKRAVHNFKANTDPRQKEYRVERCRDGVIVCTCPGFMYRQTCKHVIRAKEWK